MPVHVRSNGVSIRRRALVGVFAVGLAARLLFLAVGPWHHIDRAMLPDSGRYIVLAQNLLTHHTFGKATEDGMVHRVHLALRESNGTAPRVDDHGLRPESFRTPGAPFLIAAVLKMTGDLRVVLLLQCFLGASIACAVMVLASWLGLGPTAAVIAGLLWALHPATVLFDVLISSESVFNASTAAALVLAGGGPLATVASGLVLGAAGLVRPLGMLYVPAALAITHVRRPEGVVRSSVIIVVLAALPSGLWAVRNWEAGEGFRVTTVADVNLLYYHAAYAISEERHEDWLASWPNRVSELSATLRDRLAPGEDVTAAERKLAVAELMSRPLAAVKVLARSSIKLAVGHSMPELAAALGREYRPSGLFARLAFGDPGAAARGLSGGLLAALTWGALNAVLALSAAVSVVRLCYSRQWAPAVFGGATTMLFVVATGAVGLERLRLPMMLPMMILAGSLLSDVLQSVRRQLPAGGLTPAYEGSPR